MMAAMSKTKCNQQKLAIIFILKTTKLATLQIVKLNVIFDHRLGL